jgi:phage terminase large subunit-like protein
MKNPVLIAAYDTDWYYPWDIPADDAKDDSIKKAIDEGWSEWIETPLDVIAVKNGYMFDQSYDIHGNVIYWFNGSWTGYDKSGEFVAYDMSGAQEKGFVKYCGYADRVCRFIELFLRHTKEPLAGQPYRLLDWQRKVISTVFGWVRRGGVGSGVADVSSTSTKYRRFLEAVIEVPKKNGKSEVSSIIALILMYADNTRKAYVYGAASDRKQARIVFDEARDFAIGSPLLKEEIVITDSRAKMAHYGSGSTYEVISADAHRNDGFDAHGVIFDELHRQPNRKLFTVMRRAGQARPQPLRVVVTTYGESLKNIWGEEHLKAKAVLDGSSTNWRKYVFIASAEPIPIVLTDNVKKGDKKVSVSRLQQPIEVGEVIDLEGRSIKLREPAKRFQCHLDIEPAEAPIAAFTEGEANLDWRGDHAIRRANPSIDVIFSLDRIRSDIQESLGSPAAEAETRQLQLNIISGSGKRWLSSAAWSACGQAKVNISSLVGRRCFAGMDLSFSNDLTALWLAFPSWSHDLMFRDVTQPHIDLIGFAWVPGEDIEERETKEEIPYRAYSREKYFGKYGYCTVCEGAAIDYVVVGEQSVDILKQFKVQALAYDPAYSAFVVEPFLVRSGIKAIAHRQGAVSMGPPTKRFEQLVKNNFIRHGNHPLLTAAVDGAVLHTADRVGNRFPSKDKSISRIDPLISAVMAVGWCCDPPQGMASGAWTKSDTGMW